MKRPDCIRHWRELEGPDDATYPDSPERFSIGAPLGRGLRLNRLGIHHERLPPGRRTSYPHAESDEEEFILRAGGLSGSVDKRLSLEAGARRQRGFSRWYRHLPHLSQ